jgi:hypothetical protein
MRRVAGPGLARLRGAVERIGSGRARRTITALLDANANYLYAALGRGGVLERYSGGATPARVEACLGSLLIYSLSLFARDELAREQSELIPLLAGVLGCEPKHVMLRRDELRKAPRSAEWMAYVWLVKDLGSEPPAYDAALERAFAYQYLSYVGQYGTVVVRALEA